jgi:hypothetical protein
MKEDYLKEILKRVTLAFAITLVAFALASLGHAQQADEDPAPATPQQQGPKTVPQAGAKQESSNAAQHDSNKSADDDQTQNALVFTGRIVEQNGELVLNDPVTKLNYQLDDPTKAKPYVGKQVKIVGKLGMKKNTIHIDNIGPAL